MIEEICGLFEIPTTCLVSLMFSEEVEQMSVLSVEQHLYLPGIDE